MVNRNWTPVRSEMNRYLAACFVHSESEYAVSLKAREVRRLARRLRRVNRRVALLRNMRRLNLRLHLNRYYSQRLTRTREVLVTAIERYITSEQELNTLIAANQLNKTSKAEKREEVREMVLHFFHQVEDVVVIDKVEDVLAIHFMKLLGGIEFQFKFGTSAVGPVRQLMIEQMLKLSNGTLNMEPGQHYVMDGDGNFHIRQELLDELMGMMMN